MKKAFSFSIMFFMFHLLLAQTITVNGYVFDSQSGEPIIGATIYEPGTSNFAITNNYGYYSITLSPGKHLLVASFVGFYPDTMQVKLTKPQTIIFRLTSSTTLKEVVVVGSPATDKANITSLAHIPMEQIRLLPALGGETDIIKAFRFMPGVQAGGEGQAGLLVRGGSDDQNLILLDDVPLYYVNHLGGFISVFNSDAINNVKLYKGDFPARYGGRLSAVLDVSMKNGNMKKYSGSFTSGLLISKILLEYPLKKDTSSLLFSFRTSPVGWALIPFTYLATGTDVYFYYAFYDINLKYNYFFNRKNRLFFSFYNGNDPLTLHMPRNDGVRANATSRWGNTLFALRWNHIWNYRLFSNLTLTYTLFRYGYSTNYFAEKPKTKFLYKNFSGINDMALNYDFSWIISNKLRLNFGTQNIFHNFRPFASHYSYFYAADSTTVDTAFDISSEKIPVMENSAYVDFNVNIGKFGMNAGLRLVNYSFLEQKKFYFSPEPRITLRYEPFKNFSVKASYAFTTQFVHRVSGFAYTEIPVDLWLPSTTEILPAQARQWSIGLYKSYKGMEFSAEGFYKTMDNLVTYPDGYNIYSIISHWQNTLETNGTGWAYGIELLLQKKSGRTTGWIAYTYSRSFRRFNSINNGQPYPFRYDRPHDLSIVVMHRIKPNIVFSADWVYGTGYPYTRPIAYLPVENNVGHYDFFTMMLWEPRNSSRMEDYHRLDIALHFSKKKHSGTRTWTISVYNVYNHLNPYYYEFTYEYNNKKPGRWVMQKFTLFPFIPSVSYSFRW